MDDNDSDTDALLDAYDDKPMTKDEWLETHTEDVLLLYGVVKDCIEGTGTPVLSGLLEKDGLSRWWTFCLRHSHGPLRRIAPAPPPITAAPSTCNE
jgi:hypothetical protein